MEQIIEAYKKIEKENKQISLETLIEDTKNRIVGLIGIQNFEYKNLIDFKREILEKNAFFKIFKFEDMLTSKQKQLLENYKIELYESVIYGSPLDETKEEKKDLEIGEELYFISKNIEKILKKL